MKGEAKNALWSLVLLVCGASAGGAAERPQFRALDLKPHVNAGWNVANVDLRAVEPGRRELWGIPCDLIDAARNNGKALLALRSERLENGPETIRVPVDARAAAIHFIQTAAYSQGRVANWIVHYEDRSTVEIPIRHGLEIGDWWNPRPGHGCEVAFTVEYEGAAVGMHLFSWNNPKPKATIAAIEFRSPKGPALPLVAAVTLSTRPVDWGEDPSAIRVNCGAGRRYVDKDGWQWLPDRTKTEENAWGAVRGHTFDRRFPYFPGDMSNPDVYITERYGMDAYEFSVAPGAYTVRLYFAETADAVMGPGERVFNVSLNGQVVLDRFDPFKAARGVNQAVVREFKDIKPDREGKITISFTAIRQSPVIQGIEVLKQP